MKPDAMPTDTWRKPKQVKLIPPDKKRCQAEKREGTFMSLGGSPHRLIRCKNKPLFVATETEPSGDGQRGSMSLCGECSAAMIEQCGPQFATFKPISQPRA